MSERSNYSTSPQVLAVDFKESLNATNAPIHEVVRTFIPDYAAMIREHDAEKKKRRARNRQRRHRARPRETSIAKLASTLRKATDKPRGNKQLEQFRHRVGELASFRFLSRIIIARHGPMSDANLARHLGDGFTRKKAWQLRQIVADLEAEGGPWHSI
ncbi:hypothetical protein [Bradyrhizobium sp. RP6]|uniref:hypothetical protein n=1 Tax=Bradyrhizobium sp. RP6 TaxID=2489596 RepID=UPI000F543FBD|nr:hypothetical protein [Bradyrhizobium sp. RP6]RQH14939.1 hypothetical protein EHH60_07105 [Bradyrhizobium sp. RP6]